MHGPRVAPRAGPAGAHRAAGPAGLRADGADRGCAGRATSRTDYCAAAPPGRPSRAALGPADRRRRCTWMGMEAPRPLGLEPDRADGCAPQAGDGRPGQDTGPTGCWTGRPGDWSPHPCRLRHGSACGSGRVDCGPGTTPLPALTAPPDRGALQVVQADRGPTASESPPPHALVHQPARRRTQRVPLRGGARVASSADKQLARLPSDALPSILRLEHPPA
jgi:hypothetical protein